jgi:hypothetical protein
MELNHYALQELARDRIARARAEAACRALARSAVPRRPLRVRLGVALVALGQRLLTDAVPSIRGASTAP